MHVNMQAFEEARRAGQITEYEVYPRQSSDVEDYQVKAEDVPSPYSEDVRMLHDGELIDYWEEEKGIVWSKLPKLLAKTPQLLFALFGGIPGSASNIGNAFVAGDDFADGTYDKWTVGSGTWSAANYYLRWESGATAYIHTPCTTVTGFAIEGKFYYESALQSGNYFRVGLLNASQDGYSLFLNRLYSPYEDVKIERHTDYWTAIGIAAVTEQGVTEGAWHTLKFTRDANGNLKGYIDDVEKISTTDTTITSFVDLFIADRGYAPSHFKRYDGIRVGKHISPEPLILKKAVLGKAAMIRALLTIAC